MKVGYVEGKSRKHSLCKLRESYKRNTMLMVFIRKEGIFNGYGMLVYWSFCFFVGGGGLASIFHQYFSMLRREVVSLTKISLGGKKKHSNSSNMFCVSLKSILCMWQLVVSKMFGLGVEHYTCKKIQAGLEITFNSRARI